jgi:single-strand DNA-binding protein
MKQSLNRVFLCGRLIKDPDLRHISSNLLICRFTVETEHTYVNKKGVEVCEVCLLECEAWDKQATACASHLNKGSYISVDGRLKQERWVDNETGIKKSKHLIVVDEITFMESKVVENEIENVVTTVTASDIISELPF